MRWPVILAVLLMASPALADITGPARVIDGAIASFECATRFRYDGGDHVIFVGEVTRMKTASDAAPLVFFRGAYRDLGDGA